MLTDIEELLSSRLGFDLETVGRSAVAAMIGRAMEHDGFSDPKAYALVLRNEPEAWERFVDQVVIPETWFFRDGAPFELAADLIRAHLHAGSGRIIRILSCPCSTGEEPYSLVLSMLLTGAPPDSFCVDAVDVSRRALEVARAAVFNPRSFRGDSLWDLNHYFDYSEGHGSRRLNAAAGARVRFRQGNIIAPDFLHEEEPYDLVFCRNLLIYLHAEARMLVMTALHRLLAENGILVLGHAEAALAREHGFRPTGPTGAFAFLKSSDQPVVRNEATKRLNLSSSVSRVPPRVPILTPSVPPPIGPKPFTDSRIQCEESLPSLLATAAELGNTGQLHSALQTCNAYLQQVPDSPEGYFLLGVIHDALGHLDLAVNSFRKVLYLDPNHQEALLCLALKQESRGDSSGAALLRERAARAERSQDK